MTVVSQGPEAPVNAPQGDSPHPLGRTLSPKKTTSASASRRTVAIGHRALGRDVVEIDVAVGLIAVAVA
jgi:hypothetical protein